jgi:hypothetical protein
MSFLENEDFEHIGQKIANKAMFTLVNNYTTMDEPVYQSSYLGKISSSDFSRFRHAFYDYLDMFGLGKLENVKIQLKKKRCPNCSQKMCKSSSKRTKAESRESPLRGSCSTGRSR